MNIHKIIKLLFTIFIILNFSPVLGQRSKDMAPSRRQNMFGHELFIYKYYNFAPDSASNLSQFDFHFAVVNDLLTFLKDENDLFKARYEISVIVYNEKKEAIVEKTVSNRITVSTFPQTNSRINPVFHSLSVMLAPGKYDAIIQLADLESGESIIRDLVLTFRDFSRNTIHISDPVFVDEIDCSDDTKNFTPNLHNVFDNINSAFSVYFEIYPPADAEKVKAKYVIFDNKGKPLQSIPKEYDTRGKDKIIVCFPLRDYISKPGEYYFVANGQYKKQTTKVQRLFRVFWGNMPLQLDNLDVAIDQMELIANKKTIDSLRNADEEERKILFDNFWQKRDPSPKTSSNELKEEFFSRIDFCNRNFTEVSASRAGWETDRGKIYIKYGPPDRVDRQDAEMNLPATESWFYNRLSRRYYFADRQGDGIFRLIKVE